MEAVTQGECTNGIPESFQDPNIVWSVYTLAEGHKEPEPEREIREPED
jgi:hypothetical protein